MNKPFVLDSSAVTYLQEKLTRNPKAMGVRLMVKATGCQGHSYVVDFAQSLNPEDKLYEDQGIKLIVDNTSFDLMKGSVVKCIQKGMQDRIIFDNPNAEKTCGCGSSFKIGTKDVNGSQDNSQGCG